MVAGAYQKPECRETQSRQLFEVFINAMYTRNDSIRAWHSMLQLRFERRTHSRLLPPQQCSAFRSLELHQLFLCRAYPAIEDLALYLDLVERLLESSCRL